MAIIRWTPGGIFSRDYSSDLESMRTQMMNLFDTLSSPARRPGLSRTGVFPPLNIYEDENNLYLNAEMPGISADELNVVVENDKLIIRGERKIGDKDQKINIHRQERESGQFRRVVNLPIKIDADKVTAATRNGILEITLPKHIETKPRQINVQTS